MPIAAPAGSVAVMNDELAVGRPEPENVGRTGRRWAGRWRVEGVVLGLGLVALLGWVAIDQRASAAPETEVAVVVQTTAGVQTVSVDSGEVRDLATSGERVDSVSTVGDTILLRTANSNPGFADVVNAFTADESAVRLGEADRVVVDGSEGVWLVVDGGGADAGGVVLTGVAGSSRSRVYTVPAHRQVVGTATDGLVTLVGTYRDRRLQVWNPLLGEVMKRLGYVTGVLAVHDDRVLISRGCLTLGCSYAVIDMRSGTSRDVVVPQGWEVSGPAALAPDGETVAQVVSSVDGDTALAMGSARSMQIVPDVSAAVAAPAFFTESGWLAVADETGDVVLVRGNERRTVDLPPGVELVGVIPQR